MHALPDAVESPVCLRDALRYPAKANQRATLTPHCVWQLAPVLGADHLTDKHTGSGLTSW